jgi:hypothetical protein
MTQPAPQPDPFRDEHGYFRSPEDAAAYAIIASGGQGYTTPAREARRMLAGGHPAYVTLARCWLQQRGLPETGESEPPGWQDWYGEWIRQHPGPVTLPQEAQPTWPGPELHAVPDLPPPPPKKVTIQVEQGSRLESLLAHQSQWKATKDEAEKQLAAIKSGITTELTEQYPGTGAFDIPGAPGREPLTLRHTAPNMFDTKRFKDERPDLYPQYLKPSPRWTLGVPQKKGGGQ